LPDGGAFVNWEGKAITGRGVVFFNPDDECWQAARGDGQAVIIVGGIDEGEAARLIARITEDGPDPGKLDLPRFKALLDHVRDKAGSVAMYDSTRAAVAKTMSRVEPGTGIDFYGLYRRNKDLCAAVFVPGEGLFKGPAATPQRFRNGAVVLKHGDSIRLIQKGSFESTYKHADGRPIRVSELKTQTP